MSHNTDLVMRLVSPHLDPRTLARFAAASRNARAMTSPNRKKYELVRRLVRRRAAIIRHTSPTMGRLASPLYENRMEAIRRAQRPTAARAMKLRRLRQAATRAHLNYQRTGTNAAWNRFARVHIKSGGLPNINRVTARRMYN
jgi:hypothetical protein